MRFTVSRVTLMALTLLVLFCSTSCLKTRAQLKDENSSGSNTEEAKETAPVAKGSQYELQEIKTEMTEVSGRIDEVEHTQKLQNTAELKESVAKLDTRTAELEKNQLLILSELKNIKDKLQNSPKPVASTATNKALLAQGYESLGNQRYEDAADKFQTVLTNGAKGKEAADARFGLGEAQFGLKEYKKAIVEYSKVQDESPKSFRVPASLYHIGLSFQRLNMSKEAKGFFQELVERYPKSSEAKKARAKFKG